MANEAVRVEDSGLKGYRRTVAEDSAIEKGATLVLADLNTVTTSTAATNGSIFGGIAEAEHPTNISGSVAISAAMNGCFDMVLAPTATCTTGDAIILSGANTIDKAVDAASLSGALVGYAEEDGSAGETIRVRLRNG